MTVDDAVYPLVIRAGGGSPRDTLSVLDQLLAGADGNRVAYPRALALLGATDVALIDDAVDALAAGDAAALFGAVEAVIDAGHDPRRFATDLLERFRDLIVLQAVPDAVARGVVDGPEDVLERMRDQATRIGTATLTRYAEVVHAGLGEMRGRRRRGCCSRWCARGCCCRRPATPNRRCCSASNASRPGWTCRFRRARPQLAPPRHRSSTPARARRPSAARAQGAEPAQRSPSPSRRRRPKPSPPEPEARAAAVTPAGAAAVGSRG